MSLVEPQVEVEYPETDGLPMGETDLHMDWMFRLRDMLKVRYRGQKVYVASNLLLYFEQDNPRRFVVPDVFVVKNCDPGRRRIYKLWEEGRPPQTVIEVTSRATKREDTSLKPKTYAEIGVAEYFLYDPTSEYLRPALQGYRLSDQRYVRIEPDAQGRLTCEQLGLWLQLEDGELALYDSQTGARLLTAEEAKDAALRVKDAKLKAKDAKLKEKDAALKAAEEEVRKLREELKRRK